MSRPPSPATKTMPSSEEAEHHVLACCLLDDGATLDRCINEGVTVQTFFWPANQTLFALLVSMRADKKTITLETLAEELRSARRLSEIGGFAYLMQITAKIPTTAHAGYFIDKIREKKVLREVISFSMSANESAHGFSGGLEEYMASLQAKFVSIGSARNTDQRSWPAAVDDANRRLDLMLKGSGSLIEGEVSWGFQDFDRAFEPMQPGQLVVLAARPSIGKSSLMRQIVGGTSNKGDDCFIATLEVKDYNIAKHMAQTRSGVPYRLLRHNPLPEHVANFKQALDEVRALPIHTLDDFAATSAKICAQARLIKSRRKRLRLVCVDHLQEIPDGRGGDGRSTTEALGDVAKNFKALAGELDLVVLVLSQLNRGSELQNRPPQLHDLRASGDIEQAADKVVLLDRPPTMPGGETQSAGDELLQTPNFYINAFQAKGRDDGTAAVGTMFHRATATFFPIQL